MLVNQLIANHYPTVEPDDKVSLALQLMDDFDILHLPVVDNNKYLGLICKDDLLDVEDSGLLQFLMHDLITKSVKQTEHFLSALKLASLNSLSLVPVVNNEMEWVGAVTSQELLKAATIYTGAEDPGAVIVLEMERKSYSFGEISRLVETNDAHITQFNTYSEPETGLLIVNIKLNKLEVSDIISTFQRYEYSIRYFIGEEHYENELQYNYDHLMSYLRV
jgi:acetoin utilization protein AcuB